MTPHSAREEILRLAREAGFAQVRVAPVGPTPHADRLESWIAAGYHGEMAWMEREPEVRRDPRHRMPSARSVLVLGQLHHHRRPPDPGGRTGMVARYAWGRDYHNLMGKRLKKLRRALREAGIGSWGGVDTAPITERAWAAAAGLGVAGKNTVVFVPGTSSWMLLGALMVDVEVLPDLPIERDHCGSCTRCLRGCPTDAFLGPRSLDATRCISYWTIEAKGLPPPALRARFGRWVFGCDACQEVCPHNHDPPDPDEDDFLPRHAWLDLDEVLTTPDEALMARYLGTPLRRPKAHGLKRNAAIVLGNLGDDGAVDALRSAGLVHPSPIVRGASLWALRRLGAKIPSEDPDPMVQREIHAPLSDEDPR